MKNDSGISGEHNLTPKNESLSPYLEGLSPGSRMLSPTETEELRVTSTVIGDSGHTGDISRLVSKEGKDMGYPKEIFSNAEVLIGFRKPFYYCKEYSEVENIDK